MSHVTQGHTLDFKLTRTTTARKVSLGHAERCRRVRRQQVRRLRLCLKGHVWGRVTAELASTPQAQRY